MTFFSGVVVSGKGEASKFYNLPTANILGVPADLEAGSYLSEVRVQGFSYPSLTAIDTVRAITETHIFGFSGELTNQTLEIVLMDQIEPWEPFTTVEAMRSKINRITKRARELHNLS